MLFNSKQKIFCIGETVIDSYYFVPDEYLSENGIKKGGTPPFTREFTDKLIQEMKCISLGLGGSACNVCKGLGFLGCDISVFSQYADDDIGKIVQSSFEKFKIKDLSLIKKGRETTRIITCIHPDAQRTMFGIFKSSHEPRDRFIKSEEIQKYDYLLVEGYQFNNPEIKDWAIKVVNEMKEWNKKVVLVISDMFWVEGYREVLKSVFEKVNISTGTEDEYMKLTGIQNREELLEYLKTLNKDVIAVTLGAEGAYLIYDKKILFVHVHHVDNVVDTTGAGDAFTAGLICGYINNLSMEKTGKLASILASNIVCKVGTDLDESVRGTIEREI